MEDCLNQTESEESEEHPETLSSDNEQWGSIQQGAKSKCLPYFWPNSPGKEKGESENSPTKLDAQIFPSPDHSVEIGGPPEADKKSEDTPIDETGIFSPLLPTNDASHEEKDDVSETSHSALLEARVSITNPNISSATSGNSFLFIFQKEEIHNFNYFIRTITLLIISQTNRRHPLH